MTESDIIALIKRVVKQELAPIMMASVVSNESNNRSTLNRFASDANIPNARNIQPYGLSSRAPAGKSCLIIPVDGQPTHLNMVGHFDETRPGCEDGETVLYGADGQLIIFKNGGTIHQGSPSADEPVVLGNVLLMLLTKMFNENWLQPPQIAYDAFGLQVFLDPQIRTKMEAQKETYVDTADTNIVGQKNFVERSP